jgi:hypothetical protein
MQINICAWREIKTIFQVLTAAKTKITVFWDAAACSLVKTDQWFIDDHRPDNEDAKNLWYVGKLVPDYTE